MDLVVRGRELRVLAPLNGLSDPNRNRIRSLRIEVLDGLSLGPNQSVADRLRRARSNASVLWIESEEGERVRFLRMLTINRVVIC